MKTFDVYICRAVAWTQFSPMSVDRLRCFVGSVLCSTRHIRALLCGKVTSRTLHTSRRCACRVYDNCCVTSLHARRGCARKVHNNCCAYQSLSVRFVFHPYAEYPPPTYGTGFSRLIVRRIGGLDACTNKLCRSDQS